jgi:hypothetical protein
LFTKYEQYLALKLAHKSIAKNYLIEKFKTKDPIDLIKLVGLFNSAAKIFSESTLNVNALTILPTLALFSKN